MQHTNSGPKHAVILHHDWGQPHEYRNKTGGSIAIRVCRCCRAQQRTLLLGKEECERPEVELIQSTNPADQCKLQQALSELADTFRRVVEQWKEHETAICDGTAYASIAEFAKKLDRSYHGVICGPHIPILTMEQMIATNNGKSGTRHRRKVLLAYKQGLVCDVCDNIALSLDELTEDHILPRALGGQSTLMNLRLLCQPCNQTKAALPASDSDVSPFAWSGKQCEHHIKCSELDQT